MKLQYKKVPENEGGGAVPGCGTIHISEIKATLTKLSDELEWPIDFGTRVTGSTGKSEYSGDIDVVVEDSLWGHGQAAFAENLVELYGKDNVRRTSQVHLKYPIQGFDPSKDERKPRTGFVQIDFEFGNYTWEAFFHYSPGSTSGYKGAHRNLAVAALCSVVDETHSPVLDCYSRPEWQVRWKWSPLGFMRVRRTSLVDKYSTNWLKKQHDELLQDPIYDPVVIARTLLPVDGLPEDLHSLETILDAIKRNFGMVDQERIRKKIAENCYTWKGGGENFIYPAEIENYAPKDPKTTTRIAK